MLRRVLSPTCCDVFCRRPIAACFVVDLLQWVVVSSTISSFVGFCVDSLDDKVRSDKVIRSNNVR